MENPTYHQEELMGQALVVKEDSRLVKVGDRTLSLVGWTVASAKEHLLAHLDEDNSDHQWCDVPCFARTMFGRNTPTARESIRRRLPALFRSLLTEGVFVVISHDVREHGKATAAKILTASAGTIDRQYAEHQLKRMEARRQISEQKLQLAQQLLLALEPEAPAPCV